jgi:hypothetical protein
VLINIDPRILKTAMSDPEWFQWIIEEKGFFGSKKGIVNAMNRLISSGFLNKIRL